MDTLVNLKAFLSVARTGSFAAAARELNIAPSVVTKRISQIEWRLKTVLFERSTRRVSLTSTGLRYLPAVRQAVADMDGLFSDLTHASQALQGPIRIKVPSALAVKVVGPVLERFQQHYPLVSIELLALDRSVNPADEGFDMALTLMPDAFSGALEEPLCPMPRYVCASPVYLARKGSPTHPRELPQHDILNFLPTGTVWTFEGASGAIQVQLQPRLNTNEAQLLLSAALSGNGIALLSGYLATPALKCGELVSLLTEFPVPDLWLKALIPMNRIEVARVQVLLQWLKSELRAESEAGLGAQN